MNLKRKKIVIIWSAITLFCVLAPAAIIKLTFSHAFGSHKSAATVAHQKKADTTKASSSTSVFPGIPEAAGTSDVAVTEDRAPEKQPATKDENQAQQIAKELEGALANYRDGAYDQAFFTFNKLGRSRNSTAEAYLGVMYSLGQGTDKDLKQAVHWYRLAAHDHVAVAQYNLALMELTGKGTKMRPATALELFKQAADSGMELAQLEAGKLYLKGVDDAVEQDRDAAAHYLGLAAASGNTLAQQLIQENHL